MTKLIVFTDLDGTLLDSYTYSFEPALPALRLLKEKEIPLVICSSKTRKELEFYRFKLGNVHPFVSENGGGIFIPRDYFDLKGERPGPAVTEENSYLVMRLGARYADLRRVIEELREEGFGVRGFGDMPPEELSAIAHMPLEEAKMAREREFDEPFVFQGERGRVPELLESIRSKGFRFTQGSFFHILGESDKGRAVSILSDLFSGKFGEIATVGIGDSPNDIPMLERVDYPVVVRKKDGSYDQTILLPNLIKADGVGPDGWNKAVSALLSRLGY